MKTELQHTAPLPPALRALALGLLIEAGVTVLGGARNKPPVPPDPDELSVEGEGPFWQALRNKCWELSALVLRADDPGEAAAYVLAYLPKHIEHVFEQLFGHTRRSLPSRHEAWSQVARGGDEQDTGPS
jgi:hypothetical protein